MSNYSHVLLITDGASSQMVYEKTNFLASCFGARLSIGFRLPQSPMLPKGIVNLQAEYRETIKSQLRQLGDHYKIPLDDQLVLSQDCEEPGERLRKNGIDLIIMGETIEPFELPSQLTSQLVQQYTCPVLFVKKR